MRAFVVVIDACGAGALPDAADYGDAGTNTLQHVAEASGGLDLPVLTGLGIGNILPLPGAPPAAEPVLHGRLHPLGPGKDTISGHWELMGVVTPVPLRTYPDGFPAEVVAAIEREAGRGVLCNRPYSGTQVIEDFGAEHVRTGALIVYTSADSVLQIAAHEEVVALDELYDVCRRVRVLMQGEHAVGRVIARPFLGEPGHFDRTDNRHDFALRPPGRSYLEEVRAAGIDTHSVGKVRDVFDGVGVGHQHPGASNAAAIASITGLMEEMAEGLVFANLVETDQRFGHRNDVPGFHGALREIDRAVGRWLELCDPARDLLVLTADHGCDPTHPGTDHTREHAPLLARFDGHGGRRHDGAMSDVGASCLRWLTGRESGRIPGEPFVP